MTKLLVIGDPHIQVSNMPEINAFIDKVLDLVDSFDPSIIVVLGDVLHDHERIHSTALNKAYEFIHKLRAKTLTYILSGNHDYTNNQAFLTDHHWMNGMKEWNNVVVVDKVVVHDNFVFVPYVPPGRFEEALNTINDTYDWKQASCIFAHQEFAGCKMGAIMSTEGDHWNTNYPQVVSGHIHSRQKIQNNIYYTGSAIQHAFGESEKNIIACMTFKENSPYELQEVDLGLARKKIVYMDVQDIDEYIMPEGTNDQVKLTVSGNYNEFKALKKTPKYKQLLKQKGLKVVFKPKKIKESHELDKGEDKGDGEAKGVDNSFIDILDGLIKKEKNIHLLCAYDLIIHDRKTDVDNVMFL